MASYFSDDVLISLCKTITPSECSFKEEEKEIRAEDEEW